MNELERKVGKDVLALHDLQILARTRMDAYEAVLFGSRFSLLRALLLSIFAPYRLKEAVELAHEAALKTYNDRTVKLAEDLVKKSRLTVVGQV